MQGPNQVLLGTGLGRIVTRRIVHLVYIWSTAINRSKIHRYTVGCRSIFFLYAFQGRAGRPPDMLRVICESCVRVPVCSLKRDLALSCSMTQDAGHAEASVYAR